MNIAHSVSECVGCVFALFAPVGCNKIQMQAPKVCKRNAEAAFDQSGADTRRVLCLVSYFAASTANASVCVFLWGLH